MLDTSELRNWAEKHAIEKRSLDGFWESLMIYEREQKEEFLEVFGDSFDKKNFNIVLNKVALYIDKWDEESYMSYGYDYVISYVPIVYNDEKIGEYRVLFTLLGEIFDDFFVIY